MERSRLKRSRSGWREAIFSNSQPNGSRHYRPIQERTIPITSEFSILVVVLSVFEIIS